jgi:nucleoside 2-deoxyribosyltransferase
MGMRRPEVVYLAGPYRPYTDEDGTRHTIAQNVREAGIYGIEVWRRGYVALVPHTLTYLDPKQQRQDGGLAGISPETFMEGELELIRRSDFVVMLPEWRHSRGAAAEKQFAEEIGKPVYEWSEFTL